MKKTLYELTDVYNDLTEILEDQGGELTPELEKALDDIGGEIEQKLENIGRVFQTLKAEIDVIDAERRTFIEEANRLKAQVVSRENRISSLKEYVTRNLEALGISKKKTETFSFWTQTTNSVEEVDITSVPDKYKRVEYNEYVDKKALIDDWKAMDDPEAHRDFGGAKVVAKTGLRYR